MSTEDPLPISLKTYLRKGAFVHFIGCGGAGTKPLLKIFADLGFAVSGSDMAESGDLAALRKAGFTVFCGHRKENLPAAAGKDLLVVYSSAVKEDNPELVEAKKRSAACILRGEALGLVARLFPCVIAVSGTHGKTSTSSMIVHILEKAGRDPDYLIGGNLPGRTWSGRGEGKKIFVCEADESDGTHTAVHASCAVVSNIEDDHVWNFAHEGDLLDNFRSFAFSAPLLVYNAGEKTDLLYLGRHPSSCRITKEDREAPEVKTLLKAFPFYQKENAFLAAKSVEKCLGIPLADCLQYLQDFPGVERRLSVHHQGLDYTLVEDYAHHPSEVAASLKSLREMYPTEPLFLVFQPHRYARLERYFSQFVSVLGEKEYSPEKVFVAPVFAAWTDTGKVGSPQLAAALGKRGELLAGSWENMARKVLSFLPEDRKGKRIVLAVLGAGDVRKILPILGKELRSRDRGEVSGVIVAAGGASRRYGERNKLLEELEKIPLFLHSLKNFAPFLPSEHIVLVVPASRKEEFASLLEKYAFLFRGKKILLAEGGSCREESVRNGLSLLPENCKYIAVHDAARPFADHNLLAATVDGAEKHGGCLAAGKVTDTIKETDEEGRVIRTIPRTLLYAAETPQTFRREILLEAFQKGLKELEKFTDDASLVEKFSSCRPVVAVSETFNGKITYSSDLALAEYLLEKREK